MRLDVRRIQEPELEFGGSVANPYIKDALLLGGGPYESNFYKGTRTVRLGLVALESETDSILGWIGSLQNSIISSEANALRFREYQGTETVLHARFEVGQRHVRQITLTKLRECLSRFGRERFESLMELYVDHIQSLFGDNGPDCILVSFPEEVAALRMANNRLTEEERTFLERMQEADDDIQMELFELSPEQKKLAEELLPQADELLFRNFHRALKAKCMKFDNSVPLQILRKHTYQPDLTSQTPATIAWNISLGLYYKAGNIPWRLNKLSTDTCFVGVSFHYLKRRSGEMVYASVAQAFSSSGEGFALKGSTIPRDQTRSRRPYLNEAQASSLMYDVLGHYEAKNGNLPARVVVHKTSRYQPEEEAGLKLALLEKVPTCDLVWMVPSGFRLLRRGTDPPERGTLCIVENKETFLFTTGYVSQWKEYPGPHIPSPLEIGTGSPENIVELAREILALTKMNWNSAEGMGRHPITLSFARRVGMIMTELDDDVTPNPLYKFYM